MYAAYRRIRFLPQYRITQLFITTALYPNTHTFTWFSIFRKSHNGRLSDVPSRSCHRALTTIELAELPVCLLQTSNNTASEHFVTTYGQEDSPNLTYFRFHNMQWRVNRISVISINSGQIACFICRGLTRSHVESIRRVIHTLAQTWLVFCSLLEMPCHLRSRGIDECRSEDNHYRKNQITHV